MATGYRPHPSRAGNGSDPVTIAAGNAHATNNVTACSAIGGGGGSCTIKVSGDYFSYGVLGNGKYAGTLTIDWSTYALNSHEQRDVRQHQRPADVHHRDRACSRSWRPAGHR